MKRLCHFCGEHEPHLPCGSKCFYCYKPRAGMHFSSVRQCWDCGKYHRDNHVTRCGACRATRGQFNSAQTAAIRVVSAMVKGGFMPPARELVCVDCGKPAKVYDHRDYSKPLDVQPVCRPCNGRRGYTPQTRPKFGPRSQSNSYHYRLPLQ